MKVKNNLMIGKTTCELNLPKLIMSLGQYWYQYLHTKHWNLSSIISHLDPTGLYSQSCMCGKSIITKCHTLLAMTQKGGELIFFFFYCTFLFVLDPQVQSPVLWSSKSSRRWFSRSRNRRHLKEQIPTLWAQLLFHTGDTNIYWFCNINDLIYSKCMQ